jgi:hypothetical protein
MICLGKIMKRTVFTALFLILAGALAAAPAFASLTPILYNDTGSGSSVTNGWEISDGYAVTDSFTVCCSQIVMAQFEVWVSPGDAVSSINWAITTEPFGGTTVASGVATGPNNSFFPPADLSDYSPGSAPDGEYSLLQEYFYIEPNLLNCCGAYWFELSDAVATNNDPVYWDESDGPSTAYQTAPVDPQIPSETFEIIGYQNNNCTPEPSSFLLLGSGLVGLAGLIKRKLKA